MIVEGQIHGGAAQGLGQALTENTIYDDSGQLASGSFMDYAMPRADMIPNMKVEHYAVACRTNPLGVKGIGEAGSTAVAGSDQRDSRCLAEGGASHTPGRHRNGWRALQVSQ